MKSKCHRLRQQVEDYNLNAAEDDAYIEVKDSDFKTLKDENLKCNKNNEIESDLTEQCDLILNEFEARYGKLQLKAQKSWSNISEPKMPRTFILRW